MAEQVFGCWITEHDHFFKAAIIILCLERCHLGRYLSKSSECHSQRTEIMIRHCHWRLRDFIRKHTEF